MKYILLFLMCSLAQANGWVENGEYRYDFGNDIVNSNTRFGKAMPTHHYNDPSRTMINQQYRTPSYQPNYQPRQQYNNGYQYQKRQKSSNCFGPYCTRR